MATKGTLITKSQMVSDINVIPTQKNALCEWYLYIDHNDEVADTGLNGTGPMIVCENVPREFLLSVLDTSSLTQQTVSASEITTVFRNLAKASTRVRLLSAVATRGGGSGYPAGRSAGCDNLPASINYGTRVSSVTATFEEPDLKAEIDNTASPAPGSAITAASVNNFVSTLKSIADLSHSDVSYIVSCPTTYCHCSCHSSCHGSRARR